VTARTNPMNDTVSEDVKLEPCPGCNRTDKLGIDGHDFGDIGSGHYAVKCQHCGWRGPETYRIEDVRKQWNTRAYLAATKPPLAGEVRGLDHIIEENVIGGTDDFPVVHRASLLGDLREALALPGRGEGFVLVPVEPTEAMLDASFEVCRTANKQQRAAIYRAMLAASRPKEDTHDK
jgi:hypothetical protein